MIQRQLLMFLLVLLIFMGGASAYPYELWNKTFGGTDYDAAHSVQQTSDGGYVLAGSTGPGDAWLIKTDANGDLQWSKTFGGADSEYANSVQQTSDGGYILAGTAILTGSAYSVRVVGQDAWLIKTDANGDLKWSKTFGGTDIHGAYSVQQTSDGGYILAGYTISFGVSGQDAWLIKTDANGNEQWNKKFGGKHRDAFWSVQQTSDGGYILTGYISSNEDQDAWLIKTNANGNQEWSKYFRGTNDDAAYSVQQTSDSGYILAGYITSNEGQDAWLIKTDANGIQQWSKTFGGTDYEYAHSVQQTSDGGYILAGSTMYHNQTTDAWVIKTDAHGNQQWNKTFGGTNYDEFRSVQQTSDGDFILAGSTSSYDSGDWDAWLVKVSNETIRKIDTCTVISSPGEYKLTQSIIDSAYPNCIEITSNDVIFDGAGYTIDGGSYPYSEVLVIDETFGLAVYGSTNVTVKNLRLTDWDVGIYYLNADKGFIINNSASAISVTGILVDSSNYNTITNNIASNNDYGIRLKSSNYNHLTGNTANYNNYIGIFLSSSSSNILTSNSALGNLQWDFNSDAGSINNDVIDFNIDPTISFTSKDVKIKASSSPASDPSGYRSINKYIKSTNNNADSWLFLNVNYDDNDVKDVKENTLSMWKHNGTWSQVSGTNGVNTAQNYVYANITSFSIFAPMADVPPASVTNLHNITYAPTYINWTWTDPVDADFAGVMVYLDQVFKTNVSKGVQYYNATGLNSSTTYTISTKTVDSTGNINQTPVDNTSTTAPPLDIEPPAGVTNLQNVSYAPTYINWTWTDPVGADFAGVMVYLNQVFKTNVSKGVQYYNATGLTSAKNYTISTKTVDSTGNINQTPVDNTSTTASPLDIEPPAGVTNLKNVSYAPTYINWTWTDPVDADFAGVMVYLDHVFKTNVSKGVQYYNATGLTPVTNYTISTKTVDNAGNINQTSVDNISTTAPPLEPINITIISPANNSINTTGEVNVTVELDRAGTALLNWNGVNESMNGSGTNFYKHKKDLLSGNFNFKVYAIDSKGVSNVSETTTLTVNRTKIIILSIDPETGNVNETSISLSPSGNVTIIIFNGTNVSGCDGAETEISIDSLDRLPLTLEVNLSTDELFLGENFSAFRNCLHFNPDIQLKFNYTVEQLEAAKIIESNMAVKFYNTTTSKWEVLELYERNEALNYIRVNVSHFSIISLIGQVPSPTPPRGGGGGGGGGGTSGEAFDNILISETEREYVNRDSKVIYSFDMEGNIVQHINFTGVKNSGEVAARVEILKNTSTLVENPPPDVIYKNLNIWVGNVGWATSKNIVEPTINFRVEKFWVSENNIDESTIRLIRYTDGTWNPLITSKIYEDADNLYFEGETTEFSPFAVSGKNIPAKPGGLGEEASVEESSVQTSTEKEPGMPGFSLLICLMSLLIGAYILQKK